MLLKRLELVGFKSFVTKTTLEFPAGITAIVGPNGSGKSNIIDAIRWLLGEREAKNIRGGKVEDLIFAGTPERTRAGFARASLVFDNRTKFFPLDYTEIEVSRRITRDGTSEYFLNDAAVRLKDLVHFFAQSKLGTRGLTIINQGSADLFVRVTPEERREMIEEVLGLRQFQIKKHEAERKLITTGFNLEKAHAMIDELLPHLRLLRKQATKFAEKEQFEKELRELEDQYFGFRLAQIRGETLSDEPRIRELVRQIAVGERSVKKAEAELAAVEEAQPKGSGELDELRKKQTAALGRRAELERELGRIEAQLEMFAKRPALRVNESEALRLLDEVKNVLTNARAMTDLNAVREKLDEVLEKIAGLESGRGGETTDEAQKLGEAKTRLGADLKKIAEELAEYETSSVAREQVFAGFTGRFRQAYEALEKEKDTLASLRAERDKLSLAEERARLRHEELEHLARQSSRKLAEFKPLEGVVIDVDAVERRMFRLRGELAAIGEMDPALVKEAQETEARHNFLKSQVEDLEKAAKDLKVLIHDLDQKLHHEFTSALHAITEQFNHYFRLMFGGGKAHLKLVKKAPTLSVLDDANGEVGVPTPDTSVGASGENDDVEHKVDHGGIEIDVSIPRKKVSGLDMLSGGERSLVSIAALFAMISVSTPPFLVLDEVDAALDEANTKRFANLVKDFAAKTQFVIVTHNRATMEAANILYGVTMGEDGTSKVLSLKLET